ncbi:MULTISPECIES: hypothetical protein [Agrobacterium]|uniref:hypothetical protein n=1 Tax=Agrobacterium tumefaciens TaxID=358 RepID=UPI00157483A0|nr:hypothetical protein [Agrobacterium tumefaciens]
MPSAIKTPQNQVHPLRRNIRTTTSIHPGAVAIPLASATWLIAVAWIAFGHGDAILSLIMVTLICAVFFGLLVVGGAYAHQADEPAQPRSFSEFLEGDVDIATGRISGREALLQIASLPIALAIGGTIIAIIAVSV